MPAVIQIIFGTRAARPKGGETKYYPAYRASNKQLVVLALNGEDGFCPGRLTGFMKELKGNPGTSTVHKEAVALVKLLIHGIFIPQSDFIRAVEHRATCSHKDEETGESYTEYCYFVALDHLTRPKAKLHGGDVRVKGQPDEFLHLKDGPRPWRGNYSDTLDANVIAATGCTECYCWAVPEIPYARMPADDRVWYPAFLEGNAFVTGTFTYKHECMVGASQKIAFQDGFKNLWSGDVGFD